MPAAQEQSTVQAKKLQGKIAVVTGGSRGIGAAIALKLAACGASVAVNYAKSEKAAKDIVSKVQALGGKASAIQADLSEAKDGKKLIEQVIKEYGGIDVLVNNAGVFHTKTIDEMDVEHYDDIFDINVRGVVAVTAAAAPKIRERGRIINISSVAAFHSGTGMSIYCASKAALNALTRNWAQELGKRQITVNSVGPGPVATDMLDQGMTPAMRQEFVEKTALGRLGESDDIAEVVAFLASPESQWLTGQSIYADGGLVF